MSGRSWGTAVSRPRAGCLCLCVCRPEGRVSPPRPVRQERGGSSADGISSCLEGAGQFQILLQVKVLLVLEMGGK